MNNNEPQTTSERYRLSWAARGILFHLMVEDGESETRFSNLMELGADGESSVRKALDELIEAGLVKVDCAHCISLTKPAK
jgi:hypothetical protein